MAGVERRVPEGEERSAAALASPPAAPAVAEPPAAPPAPPAPPRPQAPARGGWLHSTAGRAFSSLAVVLALGTVAAYSGDLFGFREHVQPLPKPPEPVAHGSVPQAAGAQPVLASNPYWVPVTSLSGDASGDAQTLQISGGALQWRVSWSCGQGGRLSVQQAGQPALLDQSCPGSGTAFGTQTGSVALTVHAGGPWTLKVEQQIDLPLDDPPLASMSAPGTVAVSSGSFYGVDFDGRGTVTVYRLATGGYALRLENFYVTPNSSLDIRFSTSPAPHSDDDVANSTVAPVVELVATAGSMNFPVPQSIDPSRYASVAVWCLTLHTVYAAATLHAAAR